MLGFVVVDSTTNDSYYAGQGTTLLAQNGGAQFTATNGAVVPNGGWFITNGTQTFGSDDSQAQIATVAGVGVNGAYNIGDTILITDGGQTVRIDTNTEPLITEGPAGTYTWNPTVGPSVVWTTYTPVRELFVAGQAIPGTAANSVRVRRASTNTIDTVNPGNVLNANAEGGVFVDETNGFARTIPGTIDRFYQPGGGQSEARFRRTSARTGANFDFDLGFSHQLVGSGLFLNFSPFNGYFVGTDPNGTIQNLPGGNQINFANNYLTQKQPPASHRFVPR